MSENFDSEIECHFCGSTPDPAKTNAVGDARKPDLAETIVRRIVENTIRVSCTRWSIVESLDEDADMTEDDLVEDALGVALGEDTGCLGDDEMDAEHIDVLFVRSTISELAAQLRTARGTIARIEQDRLKMEAELAEAQTQLQEQAELIRTQQEEIAELQEAVDDAR